ncbi:MAG: FHA domain-containing protein [Anaerolineales bacterium]|nr:FHA domain-containing protein [Anaerolineales bacterium]
MGEKPPSVVLIIQLSGQARREVPLEHTRYSLGREADNDIVLATPVVSRRHAFLERRGETWYYVDRESHNGTTLGGKRIKEVTIHDGLALRIGEKAETAVTLTFQVAAAAAGDASQTGLIHIRSIEAPTGKALNIGRDAEADIQLPAPAVSRRHAVLQPTASGWTLTDLNSTNGTFVNGQRITQPQPLQEKDMVQIGPFRLVYEGGGIFKLQAASRGLRLDGQSVIWDVGSKEKRKRILETIDISCYPQEFIGLVGGSGAGKTTLMKSLSGLLPPTKGEILVEGEPLYENFDAYRTLIGYVPQDDILHKELSVEEALKYSAKLRLPPDISENEIQQRIDRVLEQVELSGQRSQQIQSLSGGQRKRASIAVELLADPPLFFLDEPTSGLDPGLEKKMMVTLRKLANGGKTIILVTHATANITECDHVAIMSQGRMVFFGPPAEAGQFFDVGSNNFADIYTEISDPDPKKAKKKAADWEARYKASPFHQKYVADRVRTAHSPEGKAGGQTAGMKRGRVSTLRQFLLLTRRYFDLIIRDKILLTILLAIMPLLAVLLLLIAEPKWLVGDALAEIEAQLVQAIRGGDQSAGYSVVKNGQGLLFMMALASVLLGLFASAYEIVKERTIYIRERMVFLRLFPYLMSKVVLLGGFAALQCLLFLLVISIKIRFPAEGIFLPSIVEIYITMLLSAIAAIMLGLLVSSLAPNTNSVTYIIMGLLFLQIIFAGVFFELPGFSSRISAITLTRWSTEGMGVSADLEYLNSLTRSRFQPDPVTEEVSIEVEKPAEDWEPVTVTEEMQQIPGCMGPVPMPVVTENEMVTVMETVTETVTVEPEAVDVYTPLEFELDYTRSASHLLQDWGMLLGLTIFFGAATLFVMRQKDVIK